MRSSILVLVVVNILIGHSNAFSPPFLLNAAKNPQKSKAKTALRSSTIKNQDGLSASQVLSDVIENNDAVTAPKTSSTLDYQNSAVSLDYNENVGVLDRLLSTHWGARVVLLVIPAIYGTNFALGSSLNEALANPALTTALRMTLASVAILPWLVRLDVKNLLVPAVFTGLCSSIGYVGQSIALNDVDPARVSFLGAAVVVWCPILEALFDNRPFTAQTWAAAGLCMSGVAILEGVVGSSGVSSALTFAPGDGWAMLQAVGFGTQCFLCSKFITEENKEQVVPFTAVLVTVTAVTAWVWYTVTLDATAAPISLDSLPSSVWLSLAWTGLISTSANFALEVAALGRVPSSEASVFLSTEPIWAAIFAAVLLGNTMAPNDYVGGSLMILACLMNSVSFDEVKKMLTTGSEK